MEKNHIQEAKKIREFSPVSLFVINEEKRNEVVKNFKSEWLEVINVDKNILDSQVLDEIKNNFDSWISVVLNIENKLEKTLENKLKTLPFKIYYLFPWDEEMRIIEAWDNFLIILVNNEQEVEIDSGVYDLVTKI